MRWRRPGRLRAGGMLVLGALAVATAYQPAPLEHATLAAQPASTPPSVTLAALGAQASIGFDTTASGEVLFTATAAAPAVSWASPRATSAVVSVFVDGRYATDHVVTSREPVTRTFFLGNLAAGRHTLRLVLAADRSPAGSAPVAVSGIRFQAIAPTDPAYAAAAHAPVLHGRAVTALAPDTPSAPFQNAYTDTPLLAWHTVAPGSAPGHRRLEYTVLWSHEDDGTTTPALMARWGRTTDIEWVYRVEIDAAGAAVPGTAVFQGPDHTPTPFRGRYDGSHPILGTCTPYNNVCEQPASPMRFTLAATDALRPHTEAREVMMDRNLWTYRVMAAELRREGRTSALPIPFVQIHDPREYLYFIVDKRTVGPPANSDAAWVGLALGVRLAGNWWFYRSDQVVSLWPVAGWSVRHDGPVATAVRLPAGTTAADVTAVEVIRVVGEGADTGAAVQVLGVHRAFLLGRDDLPAARLGPFTTPVTLTPAAPSARIYPAAPPR